MKKNFVLLIYYKKIWIQPKILIKKDFVNYKKYFKKLRTKYLKKQWSDFRPIYLWKKKKKPRISN